MNSETLKKEMLNDVFYCHPKFYSIDTMENWELYFNDCFNNEPIKEQFLSELKQCEHPFLNDESLCYRDFRGSYVFIKDRYPEYWKSRAKPKKKI